MAVDAHYSVFRHGKGKRRSGGAVKTSAAAVFCIRGLQTDVAVFVVAAVRLSVVDVCRSEGDKQIHETSNHNVLNAVAVQVCDDAALLSLPRQRGHPLAVERIDVAWRRFVVVLAVGEHEVEVSVFVEVVLVDALQDAGF